MRQLGQSTASTRGSSVSDPVDGVTGHVNYSVVSDPVEGVTVVDVDHSVVSDPVEGVTVVDVDHSVVSDPVHGSPAADVNPPRQGLIVPARRLRAVEMRQIAACRRTKPTNGVYTSCSPPRSDQTGESRRRRRE